MDPEDVVKAVGTRIRALRRRNDLSIEAFAAEVKTAAAHISGIERGTRNPSLRMLARIADALDVDLVTLLDLRMLSSTRDLRSELSRRGRKLDDDRLRRALAILDALE